MEFAVEFAEKGYEQDWVGNEWRTSEELPDLGYRDSGGIRECCPWY